MSHLHRTATFQELSILGPRVLWREATASVLRWGWGVSVLCVCVVLTMATNTTPPSTFPPDLSSMPRPSSEAFTVVLSHGKSTRTPPGFRFLPLPPHTHLIHERIPSHTEPAVI